MTGAMYLEPRYLYDKAIIDHVKIIYSLSIIINLLVDDLSCTYDEALDFYFYNIECLKNAGLLIVNDID